MWLWAPIIDPRVGQRARRRTKQNTASCNQTREASHSKSATGKPKEVYLIAGDVILGDELVGEAGTEPSGSFNPGLKLQPCRADTPNIERDWESPAC